MPTPSKSVYRVCARCSKTFSTYLSEVKLGRGVFCGQACYFASLAERKSRPEIRFWKYVNKTEGCWLWTGAQCRGGYGQMSGVASNSRVHRFSWELFNRLIPKDICVLHKCDVRLCVRPDHLFLGTNTDNIRDRIRKRRGNVRLVTAFGETKALVEWLEDDRCLGSRESIIRRLSNGFSPEYALTTTPLTSFEYGLCGVISRSL
jgi:hypothetical protein